MNLENIIANATKGKPQFQRQLFELTCDGLKSVALRYVSDESASDDILQESYVRIFQKLKSFSYINDAATHGWMRQITATEAIRYIKKSKRWREVESGVEQNQTTENLELFKDELYIILQSLPLKQRLVFNMFAIEGYSHKEIALQLGIETSSSRSLLTRARAHLQSKLLKEKAYEKV